MRKLVQFLAIKTQIKDNRNREKLLGARLQEEPTEEECRHKNLGRKQHFNEAMIKIFPFPGFPYL